MWVVVTQQEDHDIPSVIGPFDTSEEAAAYGNKIKDWVSRVRISTVNPVPVEEKVTTI